MPLLIPQPSSSEETLVHLRDVSVDLGTTRALADVTLEVRSAEILAVAGHNGSGKSTLLGVIAGTQSHSAGRVERHGRMAFVMQRSSVPSSLPLTVGETVRMGRWASRGGWRPLTRDDKQIVGESIEALGLGRLERRPLAALSGGQRQRALVAQGLAQRADILLLDEPTAGLDDEARALIDVAIAREIARGAAVVHATHDAEVMGSADRMVRLESGQILS